MDTLDYKKMTELSAQAIDKMGVKIDADMAISDMPVGHKQFTEIARELSKEQLKLLILDEPFNALDAESARTLREVLLQCKEQDRLIILTSHHAEDIALLCDEAVEMQSGKALPVKTPPSTLPAGRAGAAGI
ncbi:MAG: hypothetical protein LUE97_02435 [Oscillospiraceae bacterium]|nr:hypothetical protein [Oscillospiraceae bacterium]